MKTSSMASDNATFTWSPLPIEPLNVHLPENLMFNIVLPPNLKAYPQLLRSWLSQLSARQLRVLLLKPKVVLLQVGLLAVWLILGRGDDLIGIELTWRNNPYYVSDDFFGVAIDAAMVTDGLWWENSDSPPRPLNFTQPDLVRWAALLQPSWVRLGGTEADKLWLIESTDEHPNAPVLNRNLFNDYLVFTRHVQAKPLVTINAGPLTRQQGAWQPQQLERLLSWLPENFNGHLEFGNEPGAHWLIFGRSHQISFQQLAQEYRQAQTMVNQHGYSLAGPANAFWPEIGEPLKQIFGSSKDFLKAGAAPDIFTWHYYPTQSNRCGMKTEGADWESLLDAETFDEFEKRNGIISAWLQRYSPHSKQWLGETGPAQCGGKAKLTDRFGASLWWLTHLGLAAKGGNETIIRQSLVGGDYALLRYNQGYSPNPDYWASVLWQHNMGAKALPVEQTNPNIRAFAHCRRDQAYQLSMVIINLSKQAADVQLPQASQFQFLDVTSFELTSRYTLVEQQLAETLNWQQMASLPWQPSSAWRNMPAHSYRWVIVEDVAACGDSASSSI